MKITKRDAAEKQLTTAIELFFNNGDPYSIHTLAGAVLGILVPLADKSGIADHPMCKRWVEENIRTEKKSEYFKVLNGIRNFLKHSSGDASNTVEFDADLNKFYIVMCIDLFCKYYGEISKKIFLFQVWFIYNNPEYYTDRYSAYIQSTLRQFSKPTLNEENWPKFDAWGEAVRLLPNEIIKISH